MIMDLLDRSTLAPPNAPAHPKDTAVADEGVPPNRGQATGHTIDEQRSYDAAISEGWPVFAASAT